MKHADYVVNKPNAGTTKMKYKSYANAAFTKIRVPVLAPGAARYSQGPL